MLDKQDLLLSKSVNMKEDIKNWIKEQQDDLDEVIKEAAADYYRKNHSYSNFIHDNNRSIKEALNLSSGKDLCYDRPSTGFTYSLWYQGRRINMLLPYLLDLIYENRTRDKIEIFDLGAGTGAVQLSFGLILKAFEKFNINAPKIKLVNIDTSAVMLEYSAEYLWPSFIRTFGTPSRLHPSYSVNSWVNSDEIEISTPWIIASYLFDSSDDGETLLKDFKDLIEAIHAEKILLVSSNQPKKKLFMDTVSNGLSDLGFRVDNIIKSPIFTGQMKKTKSVRDWIKKEAGIEFIGDPSWNDHSFYGKILTNQEQLLSLDFGAAEIADRIGIYNPPIVVRRNVKLSEEQRRAAIHDGRPTVITGPAGCGKSIVITERVLNIVKEAKRNNKIKELSILVTTFNKDLKYYLRNWLAELFERDNIDYEISNKFDTGFKLEGNNAENITFMHFDVLPTRIWKEYEPESYPFYGDDLMFESIHYRKILDAVSFVKAKRDITTKEYDEILTPIYVFDEYHRIIYGQQLWDKESYLTGTRKGRPRLGRSGKKRKILWDVIMRYLNIIREQNISSIYTRRHQFLKMLETGSTNFNGIFSHIFVDEFQDCTPADYDIFYGLLENNNNLVIAGDYAQAIHLGASASIPRADNSDDERQRNWKNITLSGSYRLPANISKAIKPISLRLKDISNENVDIITPYKGAPPGIRPIFVYDKTIQGMAKKVVEITDRYANFDIFSNDQKITILEKDNSLFASLIKERNNIAETDTILKLKGMEKNIILWSTRINIYDEEELANFIYTIMTRTSCMLIVAIFDNISDQYVNILRHMDQDLCIYWDKKTAKFIKKIFKETINDGISTI